jgi:chromosome segregation ATPase
MSIITRGILRYGLIGAFALGGVTLLVGPDRVATGLCQIRTKAQTIVDGAIDDPMALRRQLEHLADEYPDRIAEVQGEIAEVDHQIGEFERDVDVAQRVVAMTSDDLTNLKTLVARAEESSGGARRVAIRYDGVRFDLEEAYNEGRRINNVRINYQDRLAHDNVQLKFLQEQKTALTDILDTLEDEYSTYQTQLWQLDREIDAIQRNERLIELTEHQQATLESYSRFGKVHNLKQLEAKLAELRTKQEAQLAHLKKRGIHDDYEKRARYDIDAGELEDPFTQIFELDEAPADDAAPAEDKSVVFAGPIVIE